MRCENCGKSVTVPQSRSGQRINCTACGHSIYVPAPDDAREELNLAPEDLDDLQREAALQAERRQLDLSLALEDENAANASGGAGHGPGAFPAGSDVPVGGRSRTEQAVLAVLTAMRDADFDRADRTMSTLRLQPGVAREIVDRLAADQIPPPEMAHVPPAVYQGFLKKLRSQL